MFVYFSFFLFEDEIICSLVLAKRMRNFLLKENLFSDERQLFQPKILGSIKKSREQTLETS